MPKSKESKSNQGIPEKSTLFLRDINILGAVALGGAALVLPGPNFVLASWAGLNATQAGGWEFLRRSSEQRRLNKNDK